MQQPPCLRVLGVGEQACHRGGCSLRKSFAEPNLIETDDLQSQAIKYSGELYRNNRPY